MKTKPLDEVLDWLKVQHPSLFEHAEIDRQWIWLADVNLKDQPEVRKDLKEIGFQFKFHGEHVLPSGKRARWAHHCMRPIRRRLNGKTKPRSEPDSSAPAGSLSEEDEINQLAELLV